MDLAFLLEEPLREVYTGQLKEKRQLGLCQKLKKVTPKKKNMLRAYKKLQ